MFLKAKVKLVAGRTEAPKCSLATAETTLEPAKTPLGESSQNSQENSDQAETHWKDSTHNGPNTCITGISERENKTEGENHK